ncbi:mannose-6-phosphate isomerase-like protein (cupin superfamily) [Microbacterium natoriense]|uniref:Mannose-6-phosphate isomerase-like protein (Cupin superfamily) n=1 Tax=Microbacterium natoriense TaxID=284570 RepID=A0AAW8F1X1_9MICO|nr:cupin domain-containing protein [Microbacterium natoriense]MDQ0649596.1 mannose-6-phosphate isomerase-like protein (cupin superfamily) [Microbacterium natoriense]
MSVSSFPGGTSLSHLDVYRDAAPDGVCGGSPHMHLVSTEAYVVVSGTGALQTIDGDGYQETPLSAGAVVWFTPGTIHRAVNHDELKVVVLMSNAGLPEAGDAVMTFPAAVVADAEAYARAAALGDAEGRAERARRRRDLAVSGFEALRDAMLAGDQAPLEAFRAAAGALVRDRASEWGELIRERPLAQAEQSLALARAVAEGDVTHLDEARVQQAVPSAGERGFGMCGRLRTYDMTDQETQK